MFNVLVSSREGHNLTREIVNIFTYNSVTEIFKSMLWGFDKCRIIFRETQAQIKGLNPRGSRKISVFLKRHQQSINN